MFPPTNGMVEPHEYFNKWKMVDSEAFTGVDGDELTELLLRGKLCYFFIRLPAASFDDLSELTYPAIFFVGHRCCILFNILMYAIILMLSPDELAHTHQSSLKEGKVLFAPGQINQISD